MHTTTCTEWLDGSDSFTGVMLFISFMDSDVMTTGSNVQGINDGNINV